MKKIVSSLLTLALTLSVVIPSVAAETTNSDNTNTDTVTLDSTEKVSEKDVTITINHATKYHVTVKWNSLDFTYNFGDWNSGSHVYNNQTKWNQDNATIEVKNHSNTDITVDANFVKKEGEGKSEVLNDGKTIKNTDMNVKADITLKKNEITKNSNENATKVNLRSATNFLESPENAEIATITVGLDKTLQPKEIVRNKEIIGAVKVVFE